MGQHKALSAAEACRALNSSILVETYLEGLTPDNAGGLNVPARGLEYRIGGVPSWRAVHGCTGGEAQLLARHVQGCGIATSVCGGRRSDGTSPARPALQWSSSPSTTSLWMPRTMRPRDTSSGVMRACGC